MLVIKRVAGTTPDQNSIGELRGEQLVRDRHGLVQHVVKNPQLAVEDEKEANAGLVEYRAEILIVRSEGGLGRHDL